MRIIRNFFAAIGCLTVIVALVAAAWWYRDDLRAWWSARDRVEGIEPSPELAAAAAEKLESLAAGRGPDELRLNEMEVRSYLRYRLSEALPPGVSDPSVDLKDSTLAMSVVLDLVTLGETIPAALKLRRFFGDTARVNTEIYPRLVGEGIGHATVMSLQAGLVPVPPPLIPNILAQTGFEVTEGRTVVIPVPRELGGFRVRNEEVVVVRGG
ncbi:MAG: hypothetical protein ACE5HP_10680 [Gemmatimonadota bacterium]